MQPDYEGGNRDNLFIDHIYFRIEDPTAGGYKQFVGRNVWGQSDATYTDMLDEIPAEIIQHVPEFDLPTRQSVSDTEQKQPKEEKSKKKAVNLQQQTGGLFDELFDNENNKDNGLQINDEVRSERLSANVIGTPQEEAAEQIAKKYGKKVDELSEEEKAEAMKLAEKFKNATNDPLDAYRG